MSILIIDDSTDNRRLLRCILQSAGYQDIITAESAGEAFEKLTKATNGYGHVDLILMDYRMPEIDGVQACRYLRNHEQYRDIPIIMVTANTDNQVLEEAFSAGAMDYISKPLNEVELLARIRSALILKEEIDCRKIREQELLKTTQLLEEANRALQRLTKLDGLTAISNRRCFNEYIKQEWKRAMRTGSPVGLILIDIDYFKKYNDTYGHQKGDECLKLIAQTLNSTVKRPGDLVARYGGEEFVVVLPGVELDGAIVFAEELRKRVEELSIPHGNSTVSISLGCSSTIPTTTTTPANLIADADQALYQAKHEGRNRVVASSVHHHQFH